jgi:hypothetical protein
LTPAQDHQAHADVLAWRQGAGANLHPAGVGQPHEDAEHPTSSFRLPDGQDGAPHLLCEGSLGHPERPPRLTEVRTHPGMHAILARRSGLTWLKAMRFWCIGNGW